MVYEKYFSRLCENDEDAIASKAFFLGFKECLGKIGIDLDEEIEKYLSIIKKAKENNPISLEEYNILEKLLLREDFIKAAQDHFNGLIFMGNTEDLRKSPILKYKITISSMKTFLLEKVFTNVISNATDDILRTSFEGISLPFGLSVYRKGSSIFLKKDNEIFKIDDEYDESSDLSIRLGNINTGLVIGDLVITKDKRIDTDFSPMYGIITISINGHSLALRLNPFKIFFMESYDNGPIFTDIINVISQRYLIVHEISEGNKLFDIEKGVYVFSGDYFGKYEVENGKLSLSFDGSGKQEFDL